MIDCRTSIDPHPDPRGMHAVVTSTGSTGSIYLGIGIVNRT